MKKVMFIVLLVFLFSASIAQTFSYAQLSSLEFPALDSEFSSWLSPEQTIRGDTFEDIFIELIGRERGEEEPLILGILNAVGEQGWELIDISEVDNGTVVEETYLFIRRN